MPRKSRSRSSPRKSRSRSSPRRSSPRKSSPKKRKPSAYNLFVKKHMKDFSGPVTERMKKIAVLWRKQ